MTMTPETARQTLCPNARLFGSKEVDPHCRGPECPLWRWLPLRADDPEFVKAVKSRMNAGEHHKTAVKYVMEHRTELGLPDAPTHGYCGQGGRPE